MKTSSKIWMCLAGVALVALGVLCIVYPVSTLLSLSWLIGLIILVAGCSGMSAWVRLHRFIPQSGLMFFSSLLQIILGVLLIFNPAPVALALPFLFAFWVLFEGIDIAIGSFDFKRIGFRRWWILCCLGVLTACLGVWALCNPDTGASIIAILVGVGIIVDGIGYWIKLAVINKAEARLTRLGDRFRDAFKEVEDIDYTEVK